MPWRQVETVNVDLTSPHTLMPNNLVDDGEGRLAFINDQRVHCLKRLPSKSGYSDFSLAYWYVRKVSSQRVCK